MIVFLFGFPSLLVLLLLVVDHRHYLSEVYIHLDFSFASRFSFFPYGKKARLDDDPSD